MIVSRNKLKELIGTDHYDGDILSNRFAYRFYKDKVKPTGNIIAFRSPTCVNVAHMIDLEDVMAHDYIHSDDMMNFCFEIPLTNHFGGVAFQRLFTQLVAVELKTYIDPAHTIKVSGDDIYVYTDKQLNKRFKASVSIVCVRDNAVCGHLGINVVAGSKAPSFAYSTNLSPIVAEAFMRKVCKVFYETTNDIFVATTKTIS